jgi:hypothetical protein
VGPGSSRFRRLNKALPGPDSLILSALIKLRQIIFLLALLVALSGASFSAVAEETRGGLRTGLSSDTIGGYVDSSVRWEIESVVVQENRRWWHKFLFRLGFLRRG